jgi:hypothetical protein
MYITFLRLLARQWAAVCRCRSAGYVRMLPRPDSLRGPGRRTSGDPAGTRDHVGMEVSRGDGNVSRPGERLQSAH